MTTSPQDKQEDSKAAKGEEKGALPNGNISDIKVKPISCVDHMEQQPTEAKEDAQLTTTPSPPQPHPSNNEEQDTDLRLAGRRRKRSESVRPQEESKEAAARLKASGQSQTQAEAAGKVPGRWSSEEHKRFLEALSKFGKNWKQVEEYIGTRTGAQIRSHAQKYFNKLNKEAQNAADNKSSGIPEPAPDLNQKPGENIQDRKSSTQSQKETMPTHSPLALQEYGTELIMRGELLDSLLRVLTKLKESKTSDPLFAVKLTQGEELLNRLHGNICELALKIAGSPELCEACRRQLKAIDSGFAILKEISPELKDTRHSGYLHKLMSTKYGIHRVHETVLTFRKLSDWVDETRHVKERKINNNATSVERSTRTGEEMQSFVRTVGGCEGSLKEFRDTLGKKADYIAVDN